MHIFRKEMLKITLKIRIWRSSTRLFIMVVSLTITLFSEKMLISTKALTKYDGQKQKEMPAKNAVFF